MRLKVLVCIGTVLLIILCSCGYNKRLTDEPLTSPLLDTALWQGKLERQEKQLFISLQNPTDSACTVFHYGPFHDKAVIVQKQVGKDWKTIIPDDGPTVTILQDNKWVHLKPGEETCLEADLKVWSGVLRKGDTIRILIAVYEGETNYTAILANKTEPLGYLHFEFKY